MSANAKCSQKNFNSILFTKFVYYAKIFLLLYSFHMFSIANIERKKISKTAANEISYSMLCYFSYLFLVLFEFARFAVSGHKVQSPKYDLKKKTE